MPLVSKTLSALLKIVSSGKLALVVVLVLMVFAFAGAVLPQEDRVNPDDIAHWQNNHAAITAIAKPIGLFHIFTSWPFMITIMVLGINTLTCTVIRFARDGGLSSLKGPDGMEKTGFLLLHISLVTLMAGGFISTAFKMNGYIILTEGQTFIENHESYVRIVEGPLRKKDHKNFALKMNEVKTIYKNGIHLTDVTSILDVFEKHNKITQATIKINRPFTYKSLAFTHKDMGFSPKIEISEKKSGRVLLNSFVMLSTFIRNDTTEYRDFLPLSFLKNRTIVTVYPDHEMKDGQPVKISEEPTNPLIRIEVEGDDGNIISKEYYIPLGEKAAIGE